MNLGIYFAAQFMPAVSSHTGTGLPLGGMPNPATLPALPVFGTVQREPSGLELLATAAAAKQMWYNSQPRR